MKKMGERYLGSNQQLISSFSETMNVTKEMHKTFKNTVQQLVNKADRNNKNEAVNLEKLAAERFIQLKGKVTRYYGRAKNVYKTCKKYENGALYKNEIRYRIREITKITHGI